MMSAAQERLTYSWKKDIPVEQLDALFKAIGWQRDTARWRAVLERSDLVRTAWDGERLVGMARTLEDGVMCMIYDVGVHPDYQRQGIGRHILLDLEEELSPRNYASIGLFAWENNPANAPFYESLGFVRTSGMEWTKHMRPE